MNTKQSSELNRFQAKSEHHRQMVARRRERVRQQTSESMTES